VKDATGQNLDWFFEQFLYQPGHPVFEIATTWEEAKNTLHLQIDQVQDTANGVPIYRIPVDVAFVTQEGKRVERLWLDQAQHSFHFSFGSRPLLVRFDEGNHLLKEWTFPKEIGELIYQAKHDDVIGREWAVRKLANATTEAGVHACLI